MTGALHPDQLAGIPGTGSCLAFFNTLDPFVRNRGKTPLRTACLAALGFVPDPAQAVTPVSTFTLADA